MNKEDSWSQFYKLENITIPPAAFLVDFAGVKPQQKVLDVACGTGIVAITAARLGAHAKGIDLSPSLVERARENAKIAEMNIEFVQGDVESLPYDDNSFDVVLSQFGHMFAPHPEVAVQEMLRVLKPGGRIAFSTWPPELFVGASFKLIAQYLPPPPVGSVSPLSWGEPNIIVERLGSRVNSIEFDRRINRPGFMSAKHARILFESNLSAFCSALGSEKPNELTEFRHKYEKLISSYMKGNVLEQHFLMTRAIKN